MKKHFLFPFLFVLFFSFAKKTKAQWVAIPDPNFVAWLNANGYSSGINGNLMDTTNSIVTGTTSIVCSLGTISNMDGIQYFDGLQTLDCSYNNITSIPALPPALSILYCQFNGLIQLPALPATIQTIYCNSNLLSSFPALPQSLHMLRCNDNPLFSLPILPPNLQILHCYDNQLSSLPNLPVSLIQLYCEQNYLTSLPLLPPTLQILHCDLNQLSSMPDLPNTLTSLVCDNNPMLSCLPVLPLSLNTLTFINTAVTCVPNYIPAYNGPLPFCGIISGCPVGWNIYGNVHEDTSASCYMDSLFPGNLLHQIKLSLFENNQLIQQMYSTQDGHYAFNTSVNHTYKVVLDTSGLFPVSTCPPTGYLDEIITSQDSLHFDANFGLKCNGSIGDGAVYSISSLFRPAHIEPIWVHCGLPSFTSGFSCNNTGGGTLTVVLPDTFVSYYSPYGSALVPNIISGDTLKYFVPDFSTVSLNAFDINVLVDSNATIGTHLKMWAKIVLSNFDVNSANDSLFYIGFVHSPYDPNIKDVYPTAAFAAGDWLTYNIQFQNTGNDTAVNIIVKDTLSQWLDVSSFTLMGSSNYCITQLFGNSVIFSFPHINLVDSFTNEPMSHAWLQFRIKTKFPIPNGTNISNRASIYFDLNPPVMTNEAYSYYCSVPGNYSSTTICAGDSYTFYGSTLTAPGIYARHYLTLEGCDSADVLTLAIPNYNISQTISGNSIYLHHAVGTIQWVDCNGYTPITGATDSTLIVPYTGTFAAIIHNGSCTDTTNCVATLATGNIFLQNSFSIFPNPATDELNFIFSNEENHEIKITNLQGIVVATFTSSIRNPHCEIRNLSSGIYFVEVKTKEGIAIKKFVKE